MFGFFFLVVIVTLFFLSFQLKFNKFSLPDIFPFTLKNSFSVNIVYKCELCIIEIMFGFPLICFCIIIHDYSPQVKAGNSSKVLAQMTLNATTMSVMLNNLTTGATYNVRVVAYTRIGAGPYSQPVRNVFHIIKCCQWQLGAALVPFANNQFSWEKFPFICT